jgi:hypothetical protein
MKESDIKKLKVGQKVYAIKFRNGSYALSELLIDTLTVTKVNKKSFRAHSENSQKPYGSLKRFYDSDDAQADLYSGSELGWFYLSFDEALKSVKYFIELYKTTARTELEEKINEEEDLVLDEIMSHSPFAVS